MFFRSRFNCVMAKKPGFLYREVSCAARDHIEVLKTANCERGPFSTTRAFPRTPPYMLILNYIFSYKQLLTEHSQMMHLEYGC